MDDKANNTAKILYLGILVLSLVCIGLGYSIYQDVSENGYVSRDEAKQYNSNGGYLNSTKLMTEYMQENYPEIVSE